MSEAARPDRLVAVVGTGTEVGKTWVTCAAARRARAAGLRVAARKPAQSFDADERGVALDPTDADLLGAATGEWPATVCPPQRWYPTPMAPPMAADALGRRPFTTAELLGEIRWEGDTQLGFVETAGGARSPLADDGDSAALVRLLRPDLALLVADAGLGTINAVRSAAAALEGLEVVVVLNRFDPADDLHARNLQWLVARDGYRVSTDVGELWP